MVDESATVASVEVGDGDQLGIGEYNIRTHLKFAVSLGL